MSPGRPKPGQYQIRILGSALLTLAAGAALTLGEARAQEPPQTTASDAGSYATTYATTYARPRVVVLIPSDEPSLLPLLRAELNSLELEVIEVSYAVDSPRLSDPSALSLAGDAPSDFRIILRRRSIEVSLFDPRTKNTTLREVFASADSSPVEARTAVLHAVELLRWSLRDRRNEASPGPKAGLPTAPKRTEQPRVEPAPKNWSVTFAPFLLYSPGGTNPGAGIGLDLTFAPGPLGLRLLGGTSLWPNTLSRAEGSAEVTPRFLGIQGILASPRTKGRLGYDVGLGLDVLSVKLRGTTTLQLQTHDDQLLTLAPHVSLRAYYALGDSVSLALDANAMTPLRSDSIVFDDREVGRYGRVIGWMGFGLRAFLD